MSSKVKNTIIISSILIFIIVAGGIFNYVILKGKIDDRNTKIKNLKKYEMDTEALTRSLIDLQKRSAQLDSVLALRKHNIPFNINQTDFYDFVNKVSSGFSEYSFVNMEYVENTREKGFDIFNYTLDGVAEFRDLYNLIYSIEESKLLKKINTMILANNINVDPDGTPHFLVNYKFNVEVYSSSDDRFAIKNYVENDLKPYPVYDYFYPLIRSEIVPNRDELFDVQTGQLLALIPDGAFLTDASGRTYLLWEGDQVYLGYLTEIDFKNSRVHFIVNKGGIIEKITLELSKEKKQSK